MLYEHKMGPKKQNRQKQSSSQPTKRRRLMDTTPNHQSTVEATMVQTISAAVTDNVLGQLRKAGILPQDQANEEPRVHLTSVPAQGTSTSNHEAAGHLVEMSTSAPTANESSEIVSAYNESIQLPALLFANNNQCIQPDGHRISQVGTKCSKIPNMHTRQPETRKLLENIADLTVAALAPSTQATYNRAWKIFTSFCTTYGVANSLPANVSTIALFVSFLFTQSFSPRTISTYLSALGYLHKISAQSDPTQAFLIQKMIAGTYRLRNTFDIRLPITHSILNQIIDSVPQVTADEYDHKLYIAIFLFAFSAFARIGELICTPSQTAEVIQLSDVSFTNQDGLVAKATVCFRKFKHNSAGPPKYITFSHGNCKISALDAILTYLRVRSNKPGPFFLSKSGLPVMRVCFDKILNKCLNSCGLDSNRYKGHSFRIGAATYAAEKGLSDAQIRSMGRWSSNAFQKYIRPTS
ncbi:integrase/recombinase xerD homolog isoform X3 [Crassostrea virginica]